MDVTVENSLDVGNADEVSYDVAVRVGGAKSSTRRASAQIPGAMAEGLHQRRAPGIVGPARLRAVRRSGRAAGVPADGGEPGAQCQER